MKKEKMQKIAEILDKILTVFYVVNMIGGGLVILAGVVSLVADELGLLVRNHVIETVLDNVRINFAENVLFAKGDAKVWILIILMGIFEVLFIHFKIRLGHKILKPMKEGRPYDDQNSGNIKKLAKIFLIEGIIMQVFTNLLDYWTFCSYDLTPLLSADKITSITYHPDFSLKFLYIVGILYLLAYVFKYGEVLQQESDETL